MSKRDSIVIETTTDPIKFLENNEAHLLENESMNNLMLGLSQRHIENPQVFENPYYLTLRKNNTVVGQACKFEDRRPVILSSLNNEDIEVLSEALINKKLYLNGVVGPMESSKKFAKIWTDKTNQKLKNGMEQGVYELTKVSHPNYEGGKLIIGTDKYKDTIIDFCLGFHKDCFPDSSEDFNKEAIKSAERILKRKACYLWEDNSNEIVSMAAINRESKNAKTISYVYTPNKHRKKGYGSKVVAKLSQQILDSGKTKCNLYTDLSNPTSNSIYQKVGFNLIGYSCHIEFKE